MATANPRTQVNLINLSKADYRGNPSTFCQGCGHNSISSQIIAAAYELDDVPENVVKFSGIGCSSKSPTYFLNRSFRLQRPARAHALPGCRCAVRRPHHEGPRSQR
jgi:pyruvate/2-oxoacid:ferredoxin oxidoreductase beta subunit